MRTTIFAATIALAGALGLSMPAAADNWVDVGCGADSAYTFENGRSKGGIQVTFHVRNVDCSEGAILVSNESVIGAIDPPGGSLSLLVAAGQVISVIGIGSGDGFQARAEKR